MSLAVGGLGLWAGGRVGLRVGQDVRKSFVRSLPPAELPERWDAASYVYGAATILATLVATFTPSMIPVWLMLLR